MATNENLKTEREHGNITHKHLKMIKEAQTQIKIRGKTGNIALRTERKGALTVKKPNIQSVSITRSGG